MTHNELLEQIENAFYDGKDAQLHNALNAIVELHKPYAIDKYPELKSFCSHCEHLESYLWPCPTIRAIEKTLQ